MRSPFACESPHPVWQPPCARAQRQAKSPPRVLEAKAQEEALRSERKEKHEQRTRLNELTLSTQVVHGAPASQAPTGTQRRSLDICASLGSHACEFRGRLRVDFLGTGAPQSRVDGNTLRTRIASRPALAFVECHVSFPPSAVRSTSSLQFPRLAEVEKERLEVELAASKPRGKVPQLRCSFCDRARAATPLKRASSRRAFEHVDAFYFWWLRASIFALCVAQPRARPRAHDMGRRSH